MLYITNTKTGKKELFKAKNPGKVNLYVCGITPYDFAHIGHGRCYVMFDLLYRLLNFSGYQVVYCRNFTDIDDKILKRAGEEFGDAGRYREISERFIAAYHQDIALLNCHQPNKEPKVTEYIPEIIDFVTGLINSGAAYEIAGNVYFRVRSFNDYGKLSKQNVDDLRSGARVEINSDKEDALDFALWKRDDSSAGFESPWGLGRPGWHIECSAMAGSYFNDVVDIHGGGMDLIFPHHENETAQSESLRPGPFVNYWMHNAFVRINEEKMSKSLGNFFTLREVFQQFDPMVIRFYFLKHYYRAPIDFSFDDIRAVETTYKRLVAAFKDVPAAEKSSQELMNNSWIEHIVTFLSDDLNSSGAFGVIFEALRADISLQELAELKTAIVRLFGFTLEPLAEKKVAITAEIQTIIDQREQARKDKDWARADELRNELVALGVEVNDSKTK
jgi:cysteinyl-tRNA synthetase